jgi:serine/threonine-protein kinase RsbW
LNSANQIFHKDIVVKSSTDNLSQIRDFTKTAAQDSGFSEDTIGKIILAVDEACTNIIKHAYKNSPEGEIAISVELEGAKFTISIIDHGTHFDLTGIPEPDIKQYYKQKRAGGLGMFLMKRLMDEVNYYTLTGNKNQVILVKYLTR